MSLNFFKERVLNNYYFYFLLFFLIFYQLLFEIFFYYDRVLVNLDTYLEFLQLKNYFKYEKQIIDVWPGSTVNLNKYNLFTYFSVLSDFYIFKYFDVKLNVENFINFQIIFKLFIILIIFLILKKKLNSILLSSIGIFFILVDGSFSHVLHNTHRYLIIGLIICYILTTISFKKFDYIKYFFIGFVYTFSSLSIVVTGLITGLTGIFFLLFSYYKKTITFKKIIYISLGSLSCLMLFFIHNYENIYDYLNTSQNTIMYGDSKIIYTLKYFILNLFFILFGQHGNNFVFIYLFILFYFFKTHKLKKEDRNLKLFIFIFFFTFFIFGTIIDPVHYYPSRLGILTPFLIILLSDFYFNKKYKINTNRKDLIIALLVSNLAFIFVKNFDFNPNTLELFLNSLILGITLFIFFKFLFYFMKNKSNKLILSLLILTICFKFFPDFKKDKISHFFNDNLSDSIQKKIDRNINTNSCVYSNYPYKKFFSDIDVYSMLVSGEHINKKYAYSTLKCNNLVMIVNNFSNTELFPFYKMNFIKNNKRKFILRENSILFFRQNYYSVSSIENFKNITIYFAKKNKKQIDNKNVIFLSTF